MHSFQFDVMSGSVTSLIRVIVSEGKLVTSLSYAQWASRDAKEPCILMSCRNDTVYLLRCVGVGVSGHIWGGGGGIVCSLVRLVSAHAGVDCALARRSPTGSRCMYMRRTRRVLIAC